MIALVSTASRASGASRVVVQRGQILPLGLIVCMVGLLAWISSLNLGRLIHNKASLIRATDAAVYSAAVAQARALNLHAYLNRAQLAHQIAMAHLITVASAERYRATLAQRVNRFNPPATLIGLFFGPQYATAYLAARAGGIHDHVALNQLSDAFKRHDEVISQVIDQARRTQLKQLADHRQRVIEEVLVKNVGASGSTLVGTTLGELGLSPQLIFDELPGFVSHFSTSDRSWSSLLKRVTTKYPYLSDRNHVVRNPWVVNLRCPFKRHELRRKGSTRLSYNGEWSAQDDQSFHALRYNRVMGCYQREYPMGWALVSSRLSPEKSQEQANTEGATPQNFSEQPFWRWVSDQADKTWNIFSGRDNRLAMYWAKQSEIRWPTQGLPGYTTLTPKRAHSIRIGLSVKQQGVLIHAGNEAEEQRFGTQFRATKAEYSQTLHSRAMAETYFEMPEQSRLSAAVAANVFQPFWRARLVEFPILPRGDRAQ
ncbi:MAG: hypothetical protein WCJ34_04340 [Alcaligenaceae bacterium]